VVVLSLCALVQAQTTCAGGNANVTVNFRTNVLNLHNQLRTSLINGQAPNKSGFLPKGKNIYRLKWACDLETALQNAISCTNAIPNTQMEFSSGPITQAQLEAKLIAMINTNWNQSVVNGVSSTIAPSDNTKGWAQLAADRVTKVGCAVRQCAKTSDGWYPFIYGCLYDYTPSDNRPAYVPGNGPCSQDSDCTKLPNSVCMGTGLCSDESQYPAAGVNTMCPGVTSKLDDRARMRAIDIHNVLRRSLIRGQENMGNMNTFAPTGSKMYEMVWNCNVEAKAQQWANNENFAHSTDDFRNYDGMGHGENLYQGPAGAIPAFYLVDYAATKFWGELLKYGWQGVSNRQLTSGDVSATIGHWSQMAWSNSYQLGCGISPSGSIVDCQYGSSGNFGGQQVYPAGQPCQSNSDCTVNGGDTCNTSTGLCQRH